MFQLMAKKQAYSSSQKRYSKSQFVYIQIQQRMHYDVIWHLKKLVRKFDIMFLIQQSFQFNISIINSHFLKSMNPTQYQKLPRHFNPHQIFIMQLSSNQSHTLAKNLPKGYSLEIQNRVKPKIIKKSPIEEAQLLSESIQTSQIKNKTSGSIPSQAKKGPVKQIINQAVKPCFKILEQLKGYKHAWPFLQPVDVDNLGIPQYYEIVRQPMDLSTVQKKLKGGKYLNPQAFYNDINKIIKNSYIFNEVNEQFIKVTNDFQKYFFRIAGAQAKPVIQKKVIQKPQVQPLAQKPPKKKKKTGLSKDMQDALLISIEEKLQLANNLQRLAKQHIKGVKAIVFDSSEQDTQQFDLQKIGYKKIRQLQKFVRNRIWQMENRVRQQQIQKNQNMNLDQLESQISEQFID